MPLLISVMVSAGLFLVFYGIARSRRVDPLARMDGATPSRYGATSEERKGRSSPTSDYLDKRMSGSGYAEKLARRLSQADVRLTPAEFVLARVGAAAGGAFIGFLLSLQLGVPRVIATPFLAVVGYLVPAFVLGFKRRKRVAAFNSQLADNTMMLANSLKAGYSLLQSMDLLSRDAAQPSSVEYRRVVQEVGVGLSLHEALTNLLRRVPSKELDLLITAVNIQQEVGGNLSQVLEGIAHTIRERVRIKGEIKVLTSQGRYSGYVITALPIGLAGVIYMMNPDYMKPLFTFPWLILPAIGLVLIVIAYFVIMKIVNIEI